MESGDLSGHDLGRYRLVSLLGKGGMGAVYCALDPSLERRVALKILPPELTSRPDRLKRFIQEAKTAASLNHPNLVPVYEVGQGNVGEETIHFIAMELVDGETLRERTASKPLDLRRTLQVMAQVADAVAAAHAVGITHRDLKPENIILAPSGHAKVLDFGLAKLRRESEGDDEAPTAVRDTDPGVVLGTVGYMAPEQAQGREADARSDVFALGCILYELATGHRAFAAASSVDTMHKIIHEQPERLATYRPESPLELQRIVAKALEKDPDERYQSVKDLAVDLRRLLREVDSNPDLVTVSSSGSHAAASSKAGAPRWAIIAGAVAIALVAVTATLLLQRSRAVTASAAPTSATIEITRVTSLGKVISAAISPDAKLMTYVVSDQGQQSLWLRQLASAHDLQLIPQARVAYWGMTFTPDGGSIVFGSKSDVDPSGAFYAISILGGTPRKLVSGIESPPSYSPDGKRMTWLRADFPAPNESAVMVAASNGTGETILAKRVRPLRFAPGFFVGPSWSPDGRTIATPENRGLGAVEGRIVGIDVASGRETVLSTGWTFVGQVAWSADGRSLYAVAQRSLNTNERVWHVPLEGEPRPITNDLFDQRIVSLSADGKTLVSVASDADSAIWSLPPDRPDGAVRLTGSRLDGLTGFALLPDGGLVYSSLEAGKLGLLLGPADGGPPTELLRTENELRFPVAPDDGSFVAYVEMTPAGVELHTLRLDDKQPGPALTRDVNPLGHAVSPDGKWIVYSSNGVLKRIPSAGGDPVDYQVPGRAMYPAISHDGSRVAFLYITEEEFRLGVLPIEGGELAWSRIVEPSRYNSAVGWARDGSGLLYNTMPRDRANVWLIPFDGEPRRLTSFRDQNAGPFVFSPDGRLVLTRFTNIRDAVLIRNFE
ncbi:MAG: serine/threonine-protein kinase [Thermoanaerobaculia bacterium]|nr:serine/threonine-protein kinase [Thermoanaerobaculia bacterium]